LLALAAAISRSNFTKNLTNSDAATVAITFDPDRRRTPGRLVPGGTGRNKFSWGTVDEGVVQFWTGNIFETPPGWSLHIRSPINFPTKPCHVMEGILETDWMQQDIWANVVFDRKDEWVQFRTDTPFAQLVPVRRESYAEKWQLSEEIINRDTPEANRVFEYWTQFNERSSHTAASRCTPLIGPKTQRRITKKNKGCAPGR
jgi:hypothetical protein